MSKTRPAGRVPAARAAQRISAAEFKASCLHLMDRVRETRTEFIVTKHGQPVAKLVPCDDEDAPGVFVGSMKGTVLSFERPTDPLDDEWDVDGDGR